MSIFSGSASKKLAEKIAKDLNLELSPVEIFVFPDGEKRIRIKENVVGKDCIIVQSASIPPDENYMELFIMIDALKRSGAKSIKVVIPYLGYQRQDHIFRDGEAVSLEVIAEILTRVGMTELFSFDLHSPKIPDIFSIPVHHLSALPLFAEKIKKEFNLHEIVLVSPDMGGTPPPSSAQRKRGGRSSPASSSRASVVGTTDTSVTSRSDSAAMTAAASKRSCTSAVVW